MTSQQTRLVVTTDLGCNSDDWGHSDANSAPYVSHLGFMNDSLTGNQVFGVTSSNNFDGSGFAQPYVFRILVDSLGAINSINFELRRLERTEFLLDSYVMGRTTC